MPTKRRTKAASSQADFRKIALNLPEAEERTHMSHPDFRVRGKVFATLAYPSKEWGMVKLTPDEQASFVASEPEAFRPCNGAWGRKGCTNVRLGSVSKPVLEDALLRAWRNTAPKEIR